MRSSSPLLRVALVLGLALFLGSCSDSAGPTGTEPDPSDPDGGDGTVEFSSRAAPGDSARSFLSNRRYSRLRIEVDYMEGFEPTTEALNRLKTALESHLTKSEIQIEEPASIPARDQGSYTSDDVADLENQHRDHYTRADGETLRAYLLIVDGAYSQDNVVGIAYYNTSMAFFGQTIRDISGGVTQPSRAKVKATVFRHEFGHNLGLVSNGIPPQQDHHDAQNGAHCTNDQCVMYHSIETTDYFGNLFDGTVPDFEQFCGQDMDAQNGRSRIDRWDAS